MTDPKSAKKAFDCCGPDFKMPSGMSEKMSQMKEQFCGEDSSFDCSAMMDKFRSEDGSIDCSKMMETMQEMFGSKEKESEKE